MVLFNRLKYNNMTEINNNIYTIDCEGDGLSKDLNRVVFPDGNHFDPDTRIWCVTITNPNFDTYTSVCKIPGTRTLPNGWTTKAYHEPTTKVPNRIWACGEFHNVIEFTNYNDFLWNIHNILELLPNVHFKGFGSHDYDKELLQVNFKKYNIDTIPLKKMVNVNPTRWTKTEEQVHTSDYLPNQDYLNYGIKHNIEDTIQLMRYMKGIV